MTAAENASFLTRQTLARRDVPLPKRRSHLGGILNVPTGERAGLAARGGRVRNIRLRCGHRLRPCWMTVLTILHTPWKLRFLLGVSFLILLLIGLLVSGYLVFLPIYDVFHGATTVSYSPFGIYLFLFIVSSSMMMILFGLRGRNFLMSITRNWITTGLYVLLILAVGYFIQVRLDGWFAALGIINNG